MKSIGIDIGTTSLSAVVMDIDTGRVERAWTVPNPGFLPTDHPWERVQDADGAVRAARALLDGILDAHADVAAIGLTGQMHGIVYLDGAGRALGPLITWQDMRALQPGEDGQSVVDAVAARFGAKVFGGYGLMSHLHNLRKGHVPKGARQVATVADYLGMALTGATRPRLHASNAASLGLYDPATQAWRRDILRAFGEPGGILPEVVNRFQTVGSYRGVPVGVAIGDNQAAFLGCVDDADSRILLNVGTGGQVSLLSEQPLEAEEIETRPFNEERFLIAGTSLCGGRAYALLAAFFAECARGFGCATPDPYAAMARFLEKPREADPMRVDTAFDGTREHPARRGSIENLGAGNFTPWGLTRGVLEGMARELFERYRTISDGVGLRRAGIVASGNGMRRNPALQQIASEMFGMPLALSPTAEEAARGAALSAASAVGLTDWRQVLGL